MSGVKFLEKEEVVGKLRVIAEEVKARDPNVKAIYLFGSLVRGDYTSRSDADILIVLKDAVGRPMDRVADYLLSFSDAGIAVDVFPFAYKEIKGNSFLERARKEGIQLS